MGTSPASRQHGAALVMALVLVAAATVAMTSLAERLQLEIRLTENVVLSGHAGALASGIESWALGQLARDLETAPTVDHGGEDWAKPLPPTTMEEAEVAGRIEDEQARFNVNALLAGTAPDPVALARFRRLLRHLELSPALADALLDWMDDDQSIRYPDGAEDDYYSRLDPPYRTADRPLASVGELRLVAGFEPPVFDRLAPHVSALPAAAGINVNTAGPAVLMSLADGLRPGDVDTLIRRRAETPFASVAEFLLHDALAGLQVKGDGLTVRSDHFVALGTVRLQRATRHLTSHLQRRPQAGVSVRYRHQGGTAL